MESYMTEQLIYQAKALNNEGNFQETIGLLSARKHNSPELYKEMGIACFETGNYFRALDCFDKVLKFNPGDVQILVRKGIIFSKEDQETKAINTFTKAIAIAPDTLDAYLCRAEVYYNQSKYNKAI